MTAPTVSPPRSLTVLQPLLDGWPAPAGAFDPAGEWTLRYALIAIVPEPGGKSIGRNRMGTLRLSRRLTPRGPELRVSEMVTVGWGSLHTTATILGDGPPATPTSWTVSTRLTDNRGAELPDTAHRWTGSARDGRLTSRAWPRAKRVGARWTDGWSLFAALAQRPATDEEWTLDVLDELDRPKPDQRFVPRGEFTAGFGAVAVPLRLIEQYGPGTLPTAWWLEPSGRPVACVAFMKAWLLESTGDAP